MKFLSTVFYPGAAPTDAMPRRWAVRNSPSPGTRNILAFYLLVGAIMLYAMFPFYYAIVTLFKTDPELFNVDYFPLRWNWDNYVSVFREQAFGHNILNSVLVSFAVVVLSLFLGVTAAFALEQAPFRGRGLLLFTILVSKLSSVFTLPPDTP
jgi:ABC-type glycerol-3-phosphate transport system permease component